MCLRKSDICKEAQEIAIVTIDYETFGNGSGCLHNCVISPTDKLLSILNLHDVKATFYVDALEFLQMEVWAKKHDSKFLKTIGLIKEQLKVIYESGHDLQLHLHPQWLDSPLKKGHEWSINYDKWRIGDCSRNEINQMIECCIDWIRNAISSSSWSPSSFRAGGWCIQPSETIIDCLIAKGILSDSSVAPFCRNSHPTNWYDFKDSPDVPYWHIDSDVLRISKSGLIETPIATGKIFGLDLIVKKVFKKEGYQPADCNGSYLQNRTLLSSLKGKFRKLFPFNHFMADFCLLNARQIQKIHQSWVEKYKKSNLTPIVSIGHNKNFGKHGQKTLDQYLGWLAERKIKIATISEWTELVSQ